MTLKRTRPFRVFLTCTLLAWGCADGPATPTPPAPRFASW